MSDDDKCLRFFAHAYPRDYEFCYQPKGHEGECKFEPRRNRAAAPWNASDSTVGEGERAE